VIDRELVTRKLVLIADDLRRLEKLAAKPREAYLSSDVDEALAERYLERMIGRMIDVNYRLLTESGEPPPRDYFDSFAALGRLGAVETDFAVRLAACAGLRNRIVHEYEELDPARVYEALEPAVQDVPGYLKRIQDFLERESA
jgi:uncharacterized protein YutE (UPF0331/DUF86 family)